MLLTLLGLSTITSLLTLRKVATLFRSCGNGSVSHAILILIFRNHRTAFGIETHNMKRIFLLGLCLMALLVIAASSAAGAAGQ